MTFEAAKFISTIDLSFPKIFFKMYVIILYLLNVAILKIFIFLLLFFKYSIILSNPYVFVENKYDFL